MNDLEKSASEMIDSARKFDSGENSSEQAAVPVERAPIDSRELIRMLDRAEVGATAQRLKVLQSIPSKQERRRTVASWPKDKGRKTIFIGMPNYDGTVQFGTSFMALQGASQHHCVKFMDCGRSLLANAFNRIWANALMKYYAGEITHFAMIHADIVPQARWLDILAAELDETGASIVSAAVPIKDNTGTISTAIDVPGKSPWRPARMTLAGLQNLPETFSVDDLPEDLTSPVDDVTNEEDFVSQPALLANTGLWIADLSKPEFHKVDKHGNFLCYFTIRDRIRVGKNPDGSDTIFVDVIPEDWAFSRAVQALGGTVFVTRKVRLSHVGSTHYVNYQPVPEETTTVQPEGELDSEKTASEEASNLNNELVTPVP